MVKITGLQGCCVLLLSLMRCSLIMGWILQGCSVSTDRINMLNVAKENKGKCSLCRCWALLWCSQLCEGTSKSPQNTSMWATSKFKAHVPICYFEQIVLLWQLLDPEIEKETEKSSCFWLGHCAVLGSFWQCCIAGPIPTARWENCLKSFKTGVMSLFGGLIRGFDSYP